MSPITRSIVNKLYNQFHDTFKVIGNQQVTFDKITEKYSKDVKNELRADLRTKGYTEIK